MGTPMFMAPEQLRGESSIGPRTDLFALGHIAYALLAGEPYWNEEQLGAESIYPLLSKIMLGLKEAPAARARRRREVELPAAFDAWMSRATAARPEDRFERATVMVAALAEALGVVAPQLTPTSLDAARVSFVGGGTPSSLGYGSGPQRGATGVAVMSTPVVPRSRSALPLAIAAVVMAALGLGGFLALRAPSTSTVASAASMTVEPPRATAAAVPLPTVSAEPSVAPAGTAVVGPPPEPAVTPTSKPAAAAPRSAAKPAVAGPAQPVPTTAPTAASGRRKDKDTIGF
jgi:serine/threonine-protein kinase